MPDNNVHTGGFGGPGSSHQDREHPCNNHQDSGHEDGGFHRGSKKDHATDTAGDNSRGGHHHPEHGHIKS